MTNREFFEAIINGTINDEIKAHAEEAIEKMDARNAKRANTPSKTAIANAPLIEGIKELLTNEPQTASVIGEKMEISTPKASALLRQIVANGDDPRRVSKKDTTLRSIPKGLVDTLKSTIFFAQNTKRMFGRPADYDLNRAGRICPANWAGRNYSLNTTFAQS